MAKRQTETKIWTTQRWFKKLHPCYKLAWKYLTDVCDHSGIWKVDYGQLVDDTGIEDFDMKKFMDACNQDFDKQNGEKISRERIKMVNKNTVWLTGFIRFQYENKDFMINPDVPAINSALTILNGYGILDEGIDKGYITLSKPYTKRTGRTRDKDRDIDKDLGAIEEVESTEEVREVVGGKEGEEREYQGGVIYDIEKYLEGHQKDFEALCMDAARSNMSVPELKELITKFHLWNQQKEYYPKMPLALIAGVKGWILNDKKFRNGSNQQQPGKGNPKTAGVSRLLKNLQDDLSTRGTTNGSG